MTLKCQNLFRIPLFSSGKSFAEQILSAYFLCNRTIVITLQKAIFFLKNENNLKRTVCEVFI